MPNLKLLTWFERLLAIRERALLKLTEPSRHSLTLSITPDLLRTKSQLIAENALLRQQLIILHRQVNKPRFTQSERLWLVLLASRVHPWKHVLLILKPDTLLRWHHQGFRLFWKFKSRNRGGRPKLAPEIISLIRQMAKENSVWGAERIHGEFLKLNIQVAATSIKRYLRQFRANPSPSQTGSVFLKNHAQDIWACDFLPVIDLFFRQGYLFCIVQLGSRRVVHFKVTPHPTDEWVAQQLREATPFREHTRFLIRDRDRKYGQCFASVAKGSRIEVLKTPCRAPKANTICERFLGSVRRECLDHMLVLGESHMYRVTKEYVGFFKQARPHQGIEQKIPEGIRPEGKENSRGKIIAFPVLNGLHHDYRRAA